MSRSRNLEDEEPGNVQPALGRVVDHSSVQIPCLQQGGLGVPGCQQHTEGRALSYLMDAGGQCVYHSQQVARGNPSFLRFISFQSLSPMKLAEDFPDQSPYEEAAQAKATCLSGCHVTEADA